MSILNAALVSRKPMAAFAAIGVVWGAFMACMPDLKDGLGVTDGAMGGLLLWGSVVAIVAMGLAPRLERVLGQWSLPIATALMGLAMMLPAQMPGPLFFVLALMAMGCSSGLTEVYMNARVGALEAQHGHSMMSVNHGAYSLAYALAAALVGVARASGVSASAILSVAGLVVLVLALASFERLVRRFRGARGQARSKGGRIALLVGGLTLIAFLSENATETWSALYIERDLGAAAGAGSFAPALVGLTMGFARIAGQGLAGRVGDTTLLIGGLVTGGAGALIVALAPGVAVAYAGFFVLGAGLALVVPTAFSIAGRLSTPETRTAVIARATMFGYGGFFLGPPLLGFVAQISGLRFSYGLVAALSLAGVFLALRLRRRP
ncbi:MAG: MFS transporter [Paracoccaceae bacterium]